MSAPPPVMPPIGRVKTAKSVVHAGRAELTTRVAVALLRGATLVTPRFTVGRYSGKGAPEGLAFACVDGTGAVQASPEVELRAYANVYRHDWTAFGAASAFVANVPGPLVLGALSRAKTGDG